jgi:serine/threonine protein phosphatase PrpC
MVQIKRITQMSHPGIRPLNEDRVLVNEKKKVFGVFDGASSLNSYLSADSKTGAYVAAHIAGDTFAESNYDLKKTVLLANDNIEAAHRKAGIDTTSNANRFSTTAAVVRIKEKQVEILQIGDSIAIVIYRDGRVDVPLGYHDHDIDLMRSWRRLADQGVTDIRGHVAEGIIKLRESANHTYGLLNGDKSVKKFIAVKDIDVRDVATIIILSDGMYIPKADPDADEEWNQYAQLYKEGGLEKIYTTVREMEKSDPDLTRYPRYKLHDDASAVAIELAPSV